MSFRVFYGIIEPEDTYMYLHRTDKHGTLLLRHVMRDGKKIVNRTILNATHWGALAITRLDTLLGFYRNPVLKLEARKWLLEFFQEKWEQHRLDADQFFWIQNLLYPEFFQRPKIKIVSNDPPPPKPLMGIEETIRLYHPWLLNPPQAPGQ